MSGLRHSSGGRGGTRFGACLMSRHPVSTAVLRRGVWRRVSTCATAFPGWRTAGPGSTGRPAPRSSTPRSTRRRTGSAAATTPTATARSPPPRRATRSSSARRHTMGELLGADPAGFVFGPSTTNNVFSITRAIGRELGPGDEIVCTRLDHDSNVSPWLLVAADTGATVRMAEFDTATGRLDTAAVDRIAQRAHPVGRGDRGLERDRHDARHHRHHRSRPRGRRQGRGRRRAPHAARAGRPRCRRLRRVFDVVVQVVRPARRHHVGRARAARPAAGLQGAALAGHRARPVQLGTPAYEIVGRHRGGRPVPDGRRHDRARRPRAGAVHPLLDGLLVDAERPRARPARLGRPGADARVPRRRPHPQRGRPRPRRPRDRRVGRQLLRRRGDGQLRPRRRQRRGPGRHRRLHRRSDVDRLLDAVAAL